MSQVWSVLGASSDVPWLQWLWSDVTAPVTSLSTVKRCRKQKWYVLLAWGMKAMQRPLCCRQQVRLSFSVFCWLEWKWEDILVNIYGKWRRHLWPFLCLFIPMQFFPSFVMHDSDFYFIVLVRLDTQCYMTMDLFIWMRINLLFESLRGKPCLTWLSCEHGG